MDKHEFLALLRKGLEGALPSDELEERLTFYSEMIDDRMEEGLSQQEAVAAVGSVEEIIAQATDDIPAKTEKTQPKKRKAWKIALLILGSPVWLALGITAVAVVFSLYASAWAVIVSLWSVFGSLVACALGGVVGGGILTCCGHTLSGVATIGAGLVCAGLSVFMFYGCKASTKGLVLLTNKLAKWCKNCLRKKEEL